MEKISKIVYNGIVCEVKDAAARQELEATIQSISINGVEQPKLNHAVDLPAYPTKQSLGIENVEDKTSAQIRNELTSENVTNALGYTPLDEAEKGQSNGVAQLDNTGRVPTSQLPSYVDDVQSYATKSQFPLTGEDGKIYIDKEENKQYRWDGSDYAEISASLALGETSSTAYPGDKGAAAYAHAITNKGNEYVPGFYKIGTNGEGHVTSAEAVVKQDILNLGIEDTDTKVTSASNHYTPVQASTIEKDADNGESAVWDTTNFVTGVTLKVDEKGHITGLDLESSKMPVDPTANLGTAANENKEYFATASHNQAANTITAMTGYIKPSSTSAISTSDTLNAAIGKLEKSQDNISAELNTKMSNTGRFRVLETDTMTVVDVYSPDSEGIKTHIYNDETWMNVRCYDGEEDGGAHVKFNVSTIWGNIGENVNDNNPHFKINLDDVGDRLGMTGEDEYEGKAQPDSTLDLWYEKVYINGNKIITEDDINSWDILQQKVRANTMDNINIGDQYGCNKGANELIWDVIGKNVDTPYDTSLSNALTLRTHYALPDDLEFDAPEAFYACQTAALSAGTYCFTWSNGRSYTFTLTQEVPVNGQLVYTNNETIESYASGSSTTPIETVEVTEGSAGTNLGTLSHDIINGNLNTSSRRYGSNNWAESAIRQWLNSDKPAGQWWTPQTPWDRPPEYANTLNGFMYDLDEDFKAAIGKTQVTTKLFDVTTGQLNGTYTTNDYFFLMSTSEVSDSYSGEGTKYPAYSNAASRIVYRNGTAEMYWLRSVYSTSSNALLHIVFDGNIGNIGANAWDRSVVPACNII